MFKGIIAKIGFTKMLIVVLSLFFFFSIISGLVLYKNLHTPLGPHFAAAHIIVTKLQDTILYKTVVINIVFYNPTAIGVLLLGVLYPHKLPADHRKNNSFWTLTLTKMEFNLINLDHIRKFYR